MALPLKEKLWKRHKLLMHRMGKRKVLYIAVWIREANEKIHTHKVFCVFYKDLLPYYMKLYM